MKLNIKLEDIVKKYPFMYEVEEKIYYIGNGVFRECTDSLSFEYFKRYRDYIVLVGRETIATSSLNNEEAEALTYYFRKVKNRSDYDKNIDDPIQAKKDALEFISNLSYETTKKLFLQLEDYVNIFKNYYYPRFFI